MLRSARRKNPTALAAACGDDGPSASGCHACAETVRLRTLPVVRLVCALHKILRSRRPSRRPGAKARDYTDLLTIVSNKPEVKSAFSTFRNHIGRFPLQGAKIVVKLWIVWKTQDSRVPKLWITPWHSLSLLCPSDRISAVSTGVDSTRFTLKTAW